jgi:predicted transcriptional regulator
MMQVEGKTYYRIPEASEETGYTEGTIRSYISGGIVEAQKLPDGEWVLTEAGMIALRRRKKANLQAHNVEVSKPIPEPVPKPSHKKKSHPDGFKEGQLYLRTPEDYQVYNELKEAAEILHMLVGDVSMAAIRYYVQTNLKKKINELKDLEEKKKSILAGLAS